MRVFCRLTRRALEEIPHHLSRLELSESQSRWNEIWSDPGWLLTKLAASGVTQVIEDYALTPETCRPETLKQWLVQISPAIDYDFRQLASQLISRGVPQTGLFEELCRTPLVACLLPSCQLTPIESSEKDICISAIFRLTCGERHHAAALSAVRDELSLWDFSTGRCDKGILVFSMLISLQISQLSFLSSAWKSSTSAVESCSVGQRSLRRIVRA